MTQAINSGQINETGFPGSQEGLSLVGMIGAVTVVCAVSTIALAQAVAGSTTAQATTSAGIVVKFQGSASTTAAATTSVIENHKRVTALTATSGACTGSARPRLKYVLSASSTPTFDYSVTIRTRTGLWARAVCGATGSTISERVYVSRFATTTPRAISSAGVVSKVSLGATATPTAVARSYAALTSSLSASATPTAVTSATRKIKSIASASTSGEAVTSADAIFNRTNSASTTARAIGQPVVAGFLRSFTASVKAQAHGSAYAGVKLVATGNTLARAITTATAADYGITLPAPSDRLMLVPADTRNMEVVTWY